MAKLDGKEIRKVLLEILNAPQGRRESYLQESTVLQGAAERLQLKELDEQQALLTIWSDLFRIGYLAWGSDLANPSHPFIHLTERGRIALQYFSRDPFNPDGYWSFLIKHSRINPVSESYVHEALASYNSGCYKAAAVMIGCATESLILQLRDTIVMRLNAAGLSPAANLSDWKAKTVIDALDAEFRSRINHFPRELREGYESNWSAFVTQIRRSRNDAGHPTSLDPVNEDIVHASLLIFPELCKLITMLEDWINNNIK